MDDPWAAPSSSSWANPKSASDAMVMPSSPDDPAPRFDADPWGLNASSAHEQSPPREKALDNVIDVGERPITPALQDAGAERAQAVPTSEWGEEAVPSSSGHRQEAVEPHEDNTASPPPEQDHSDPWGTTPHAGRPDTPTTPTEQVAATLQPTASSPPPSSRPLASSPAASASPVHSLRAASHPSPLPTFAEGFGSPSTSTAAAGQTIPKSPSFGDDFGGFSGGEAVFAGSSSADPWDKGAAAEISGGSKDDAWGGENVSWGGTENDSWGGDTSYGVQDHSFGHIIPPASEEEGAHDDDDDSEGEGWGRARPVAAASVPVVKSTDEDDWEEAQRRIRIKQQKAPQEKIDALTQAWTELLGSVISSELEKLTGAEELKFEETVQKLQDDTADKARSLSTIPQDINTYPPVVSSLITHERFVYALQRPNPSPSTSLLHSTATRRPKRVDPLALSSSSPEPSWTSRSMLGEPDAPPSQGGTAQPEDAGKSRWSFWGKRPVPERQLTTSGGGVLEIKSMSPAPSMDRSSSEIRPPSTHTSTRAPSISTHPSRPGSPAPSFTPSISQDQVRHSAPSPAPSLGQAPAQTSAQVQAPALQPAPSAVSRFFGRLSRKQSSSAPVPTEVDAKDLELSADDFSFLSEVPSMSQPPPDKGVGDLLALEPGRNEQIASLESLLNSKAAPLPKPLAPPPRGPAGAPSTNARSSSGKFVARMKAPAPTDMDLLGDLDFASPAAQTPGAGSVHSPLAQASSPSVASPNSAWDDFMSLNPSGSQVPPRSTHTPTVASPPATSPITPSIAAPLVPSRSGTPSVSLSPPPPSQVPTIAMPSIASTSKLAPSAPAPHAGKVPSDFGELDDFGTPQHASTSTFDDFGDFSVFESSGPAPPPARAGSVQAQPQPLDFASFARPTQTPVRSTPPSTSSQLLPLATPVHHARPGSLDHTPTLNLMTGASANKGKRWPAPASPVAPVLAPPPGAGSGSGFPFLPPPPGRPGSRTKDLLGDGASSRMEDNPATPVGLGVGMSMGMGMGMGIRSSPLNPSSSPSPSPSVSQSGLPSSFGGAIGASPAPRPTSVQTNGSLTGTGGAGVGQVQNQNTGMGAGAGAGAGASTGKGLSAQDLSFFDSL